MQPLKPSINVLAQRNPGQRFAGLFQDVIRERPLVIPRLQLQRLAATGQVVEIAAFFGFADLFVDCGFPVRQAADSA
jgi:hypothetical protein